MDPYKVLGISPGADEETIKKAYRALVKKYHPDKYVNTPMQDMASEKMKEINEAYDMLTNNSSKNSNYHNNYGGYNWGSQNYDYFTISFETVRRLIAARKLQQAEEMLLKLEHNAQWHYLMGVIYMNRGWYSKGMEYINIASQMDPLNPEYKSAASGFNQNTGEFKNVVFTSNPQMCSLCSSLCLSWFFCNFCRCGCC